MFQASGSDAAKKLEDQINAWLNSPPGDREIVQVSTSVCQTSSGAASDVQIVVTIVYELD
jgi:hypothetical protein